MGFARWTFRAAGLYGLTITFPLYFMEDRIGKDFPPAITHPDIYYGFIGVVIAWQIAFLIISTQPDRFRPLMLAAVVEKFSYGIATALLFSSHRIAAAALGLGVIDTFLGLMFLIAFWLTRPVLSQKFETELVRSTES